MEAKIEVRYVEGAEDSVGRSEQQIAWFDDFAEEVTEVTAKDDSAGDESQVIIKLF